MQWPYLFLFRFGGLQRFDCSVPVLIVLDGVAQHEFGSPKAQLQHRACGAQRLGVGVGQKRNGERRVCDEGGVCERNR